MNSKAIAELLRTWLPSQRWFAGKHQQIREVRVESDTELVTGDPGMRSLVVRVEQSHRGEEPLPNRYHVPIGLRRQVPHRLEHAVIGEVDGTFVYDAPHDFDLTRPLLENIAAGTDIGPLSFRAVPKKRLKTDLTSLVMVAEQSNTSFLYGEEYICKLFRLLQRGPNPDLEMPLNLTRSGSTHVAAPVGWIEMPLDGVPTTVAVLQEYLSSATDGWTLAAASVRDLYAEGDLHADEVGGDFAAEAERLGAATADVHADLAQTLPTGSLDADQRRRIAATMRARLDDACRTVSQLTPHAGHLTAAFDEFSELPEPVPTQRIHGDYHLGQVLRTNTGWVLLDFEGEPVKPLPERRALANPLRDVAGMLRSFDYAARAQLDTTTAQRRDDFAGPQLEYRAMEWSTRNREAFCKGYVAAGGLDPWRHETLLRAYEFDKAVYEVMYEARNRPSWLHIPLGSIARLVADRGSG